MELSNIVIQRYRYKCGNKSPTEINAELRKLGVKGFVIKVNQNRVTMLVEKNHKQANREAMR